MKTIKMAVSFGVLVWLFPFIFSIVIYFLHAQERALFESLMSICGILTAVIFTVLFFKSNHINLQNGIFLGVIWILISLSFDFLFFIMGPAKMSVINYAKDIGIVYLGIPIITIGYSLIGKSEV